MANNPPRRACLGSRVLTDAAPLKHAIDPFTYDEVVCSRVLTDAAPLKQFNGIIH